MFSKVATNQPVSESQVVLDLAKELLEAEDYNLNKVGYSYVARNELCSNKKRDDNNMYSFIFRDIHSMCAVIHNRWETFRNNS